MRLAAIISNHYKQGVVAICLIRFHTPDTVGSGCSERSVGKRFLDALDFLPRDVRPDRTAPASWRRHSVFHVPLGAASGLLVSFSPFCGKVIHLEKECFFAGFTVEFASHGKMLECFSSYHMLECFGPNPNARRWPV